jgi:hypothetical protein
MNFLYYLPMSFFHACESVWPGTWLKENGWIFAIVETVHIMVMTVLLGTVLVIDMRLLGVGLTRRPTAKLAHELAPSTNISILLMIITGITMYMSEAVKLAPSNVFFFKMIFLALALSVHFTLARTATRPGAPEGSTLGKVAACLSLFCWFAVAAAGRGIAFL